MSYRIITVIGLSRKHKVSKQAISELIRKGKKNGAISKDGKIGFRFRGQSMFAKMQGNQYFIYIYK